jgi:hypothetical protein
MARKVEIEQTQEMLQEA